jgi:hypothetical protein
MSDTGILCPATIGKRPVALPWAGLLLDTRYVTHYGKM